MAKTHVYTCKSGTKPNQFLIAKMSEDLEVLATYTLTETRAGGALHCDCPAHKPWCRHCDMLRKFQAEERVDTGWMWRHEKNEWVPPMEIQS